MHSSLADSSKSNRAQAPSALKGNATKARIPFFDLAIPGLRIQQNLLSDHWPLVIRSDKKQESWAPFHHPKIFELERPATTILYGGIHYRIHEVKETGRGWGYRLKPWPHGELMYRVVELTPEKVAQAKTEEQDFKRIQFLAEISILYEVFLGFLPARWQIKLSEHWHFSPEHAARKNGLLEFALSIGLCFPALAYGGFSAYFVVPLLFASSLEGALRWGHALAANEPLGLLPLECLDYLGRGLAWLFSGK